MKKKRTLKKRVEDFYLKRLLKETQLKEIMTTPVETIRIDDDFSRVEEKFLLYKIRHLPVVSQGNQLMGIITQRDLYRVVAPRKFVDGEIIYDKDLIVDGEAYYSRESLNKYILNNVMSKQPSCLKANNNIGDAINLMVHSKVGCVVIVDDKMKVRGIVTRFDILRIADQVFHENFSDVEAKRKVPPSA